MASLPERLNKLLVKARKALGEGLTDPTLLPNSGEIQVRGHTVIVRSSAPLDQILSQDTFTLYMHDKPSGADEGRAEIVRYIHFDSRTAGDLSSLFIVLTQKNGDVWQEIKMQGLPKEMVLANINKFMGKGDDRRGGHRGGGGGGFMKPRYPPRAGGYGEGASGSDSDASE